MSDYISRMAAIEAVNGLPDCPNGYSDTYDKAHIIAVLEDVPSVQSELAIPLSWIEGQIEWLKSLDNAFSTLTAGQILAMMNKWKDEQNERSN